MSRPDPPDHARGSLSSPRRDQPAALSTPSDQAWVMMVDLVVATLTWGGIGWLADRWLDTGPWLMSIGFIVGNGAGIYLLWLRTSPAAPDRAAQPDAAAEPGHRGQRASADTGADTSLSLDEPPAGGHPA